MCAAIMVARVASPILVFVLSVTGRGDAALRRELMRRIGSWTILAPAVVVPILLGPGAAILLTLVLSVLCYREYARATGLFRDRLTSTLVVLGIGMVTFASIDHYYRLFVASWPLPVSLIAGLVILRDEPRGYIQRVAMAIMAFMFFAAGLGHFGYFANDPSYRPVLLWLLICTEMNDVFAYACGKLFGRRRLLPNTSPNKTWAGSIGALACTIGMAVGVGWVVFDGSPVQWWVHLVAIGAMISIAG